jgi:hypothetical protein
MPLAIFACGILAFIMPNQKIFEVTNGGVTLVTIEYNDANLRLGSAFFVVPTGITAAVKIWDDGQRTWKLSGYRTY